MGDTLPEQRMTDDLEQTLKDLTPGTKALFGLGSDQDPCNTDTLYPVFDETGQKIGYYKTPIMMESAFNGEVIAVSDGRIKIQPDGVKEGFLDLPFDRTGKDLAYLQFYELED